uniref:E3 ubiquitin protein ligase n=1 Tax=Ciona savignyi TaxID=51511 RepID=H2YL12_CIOSA
PNVTSPCITQEEMDLKTLKFQNKKLSERIEVRRQVERELEAQIETMQAKQTATDATLSLVNRYWDQLDENIKITLQRLGEETMEEIEENSTQDEDDLKKKSFHRLLSDSEFPVIKENVAGRLDFSRKAFAKVVDVIVEQKKSQTALHNNRYNIQPPSVFITSSRAISENENIDINLKSEVSRLESENNNLQELTTAVQVRHADVVLKLQQYYLDRTNLEEKIGLLEERVEELQETAENARWDLKKIRLREDRLTRHLAEALDKINKGAITEATTTTTTAEADTLSKQPVNDQSEESIQLAESRLVELETMKKQNVDALKDLERTKFDLQNIPESLIIQSAEYRTLKSQFSVLYHESVQMKAMMDESRLLIQQTRNANLRRIEQMECDELQTQTKLRNELIQLEDTLAKVRHDYEALHTELEQNLAASEQAGPVNREMRHLINSLQNHNRQLKGEIQRYKRKIKDLQNELAKVSNCGYAIQMCRCGFHTHSRCAETIENDGSNATHNFGQMFHVGCNYTMNTAALHYTQLSSLNIFFHQEEIQRLHDEIKLESDKLFSSAKPIKTEAPATVEGEMKTIEVKPEVKFNEENEELKQKLVEKELEVEVLSKDLKTSKDQLNELKLLLDMYKGLSKEQRDKAAVMAREKEARSRVASLEEEVERAGAGREELVRKLRKCEEDLGAAVDAAREAKEWRERKEEELLLRGPDVDTLRKMKVETIVELRRNLAATKQEEEALLSEMDVTGQAFEDMQEQNMRLLQQLREKDDANFKLMSERIKANQVHKLLQEEKNVLQDQTNTLHMQVDSQNQVVRMLEEKERALQNTLATMEKELNLRSQIMELHKRKAVEMSQLREDLLRELEKKKQRLLVVEELVDRKVELLEEEHFKISRLQEDGAKLRRKLDKHKKTEGLYSADEVLMEEIREYKTKLRCPCCNVHNKDAVLTKCFHVFCIKCIKTRYETRQRKCPKCNAGFGGNDFHRIYIE